MTSHEDVVRRWKGRVLGTGRLTAPIGRSSSRIRDYGEDTIYSYGEHFPLAICMDSPAGKWFLLNGDTYSPSTAKHQSIVRSVLSDQRTVIIPFSALNAARIAKHTIELVDVSDDTWITETITAKHPHPWWHRDERGYYRHDYIDGEWGKHYVTENADGTYTYRRSRHVLGESLIAAQTLGDRRALYLSGFDHQERLCYFLCELPDTAPTTVAEAYELLKPDTVKLAEAMDRAVRRQGDIFAVPTKLSTRQLTKLGATRSRMGQLFTTNHVATETAVLADGTTFVRGTLWHKPEFRAPDHVRQTLPHGVWHMALKNTVPLAA